MGKLQRVRCNSYSLGVSRVRDMFRGSRGGDADGGGSSDGRNSSSSSRSRSRQRTRSVRFSHLELEDDFALTMTTTTTAATRPNATDGDDGAALAAGGMKTVEGAASEAVAGASPQVMEMSMIRAKSEPSGIAKVV